MVAVHEVRLADRKKWQGNLKVRVKEQLVPLQDGGKENPHEGFTFLENFGDPKSRNHPEVGTLRGHVRKERHVQ